MCFKKYFYFGIILIYRKVARIMQEFLHTSHPVAPNVNILCNYGIFVRTKKLTLAYYCQLRDRLNSGLPSYFTDVPFSVPGCHIAFSCHVSLASCDLWQFHISLIVMILIVLKNMSQIFCRMSLSLGLMLSHDETRVMGLRTE